MSLHGRVAVITGGARGLGRGFARCLAEEGADIVVTARDPSTLASVLNDVHRVGRRCLALELDVRSATSIRTFAAQVHETFPAVDILVNNAGCNVRKPGLDVSWDEWNLVNETNLRGSFFVAQAFAAAMIEHRYGRIINIGSLTSQLGFPSMPAYAASRGGVRQLTAALAAEWGAYGVTVNCLAPGFFRTAQNSVLYDDETWVRDLCARIPAGRPGAATDLDSALLFLASEGSRYVNGQLLMVDGGMSLGSVRTLPLTSSQPP